MKKRLYLMRHGQTLFNLRNKVQGWCDSPLTELGIEQSKIAGKVLKDIHFDAVYTSTLERTSDTLEHAIEADYIRSKGLKEWNFGILESESNDIVPPYPYGDFLVAYGGESEAGFNKRITSTFNNLISKDGHDSILMVTHGLVLAEFYREWIDHAQVLNESGMPNCAIHVYDYDGSVFSLVEVINHDFSNII